MRWISSLVFAIAILTAFGPHAALAQVKIKIPDIPRVKKATTEPSRAGGSDAGQYDKDEFGRIKWGNTQYLAPYLECYAKKHNLELIKVTGDAFSAPGYNNASEMRQALQAELPKLAEIASLLTSKLQSRPNTSLNYHENPAIWEEITVNRDEYLKCAVGEKESLRASESVWLRAHLENIAKKQKQVDEQGDMSSATNDNYLMYAVSARARAKWLEGDTLEFKPNLDPVLDALAASVAKKMPEYKPLAAAFQFRDPVAEKLLMNYFKNSATVKVHRIGLDTAGWQIQKDNYNLLPSYRYKTAYAYVRDSSDDHPYCHVVRATIKQDYAGGGRYSTQTYRSSAMDDLFGCPAPGR